MTSKDPVVPRHFRRWALRLAGVGLAGFLSLYIAARNGRLPAVGYDMLYLAIAGPPVMFGTSERTVVLRLYDLNCGGFRYPYDVLWFSENRGVPETAERLFTCKPPATLRTNSRALFAESPNADRSR